MMIDVPLVELMHFVFTEDVPPGGVDVYLVFTDSVPLVEFM